MDEKTMKSIKRTLEFEKSGEKISIEISIETPSPLSETATLNALDALYQSIREIIF